MVHFAFKEPRDENVEVSNDLSRNRSVYFDNELIRIFLNGPEITEDQETIIKTKYCQLKQDNKHTFFFEQLRACGDTTTCENIMDVIKGIENEHHSSELEIYNELDQCIQNNHQLQSWVFEHFKKGCGFKLKRCCKTKCSCCGNGMILKCLLCGLFVLSIYFNLWKDIIVFISIRHYCDIWLVSLRTDCLLNIVNISLF